MRGEGKARPWRLSVFPDGAASGSTLWFFIGFFFDFLNALSGWGRGKDGAAGVAKVTALWSS